jgi:vesicle coat complex subunit
MGDEHMKYLLDALYKNIQDKELPVRVNAAIALIKYLSHDFAINFIRPGLGHVIRIYLKLIDDIDYDELIESLKVLVEVFQEEIAPYAIEVCHKLSESYLRLIENQKTQGGGAELDLDAETSLTSDGLMTAIRRVLQSISGMYTDLYP